MMRNWKAPGNRGGESMAALNAGGDKVSAYRGMRMRRGHAAMFAVVAVAMVLFWCDLTPAAGTPRVILLRGWFGVFSMGLDSVTERAQGAWYQCGGRRAFELAERSDRDLARSRRRPNWSLDSRRSFAGGQQCHRHGAGARTVPRYRRSSDNPLAIHAKSSARERRRRRSTTIRLPDGGSRSRPIRAFTAS